MTLPLALSCLATACVWTPRQAAPPPPVSDSRVAVGEPRVTPRPGQPGLPVECAIDVANRSAEALSRLIVRCELLDDGGVPIGVGLGNIASLPAGESRTVRTVAFGVRAFASARAVVQPGDSQ
jgi:hypothetical protein